MRPPLRLRAAAPAVLLLAACAAPPEPAEAPPTPPPPAEESAVTASLRGPAAFVVRLGDDTVAVERFVRTGDRLEGTLVTRTPGTARWTYGADLGVDGSMRTFHADLQPLGGEGRPAAVTMRFASDSARVTLVREGDTTRTTVPTPAPAVPFLSFSYALVEQATIHARRGGADSVELALVLPGRAEGAPMVVRFGDGDSASVTTFAGTSRARVGPAGLLLDLDGRGSTQQVRVTRVPAAEVDAPALAATWTAAEAAGRGIGALSPRDTARATVAGAELWVDYGRPAVRGRTVWGGVVPWGEVWRTGANAATQLHTARDLTLGGAEVPAGTYTLFTLPRPDGWTLIVNRQTGQWGTEYHPEQDLVRVPLEEESLPEAVERFTIGIEPGEGASGTLWMAWDRTRLSVPIVVR